MRSSALLVAALAAVTASHPSPALAARPDVALAAGTTAAIEGKPGAGGPSLSVSLLWPVEDHFRIGVMGLADDLGEENGRLIGPGDVDLGPVAGLHRSTIGAVWRMEAHLPRAGAYDPFVAATWGAYRVSDDLRGVSVSRFAAAGFGLGVGLARRLGGAQAAGITARYQQLSRGAAQRYLSAAVEWRWRGSATD
jgi:hypothetical protein